MIKFNNNWIRPFKINAPEYKGDEKQFYLHGCYQDMATVSYELLCPFPELNDLPEVIPGISELIIKPECLTPNNTNIIFVTHPLAASGKSPIIIPTSFQTDWWTSSLKLWFVKTELKIKQNDPLALILVVKRIESVVSNINIEEKQRIDVFNNYLSENENKLKTRNNNIYERVRWLVETNQLSFKPKRKYKLL